jgi:hypothetical protein
VRRLVIDGNNLLHRTVGNVEEGAQRGLLARLRVILPARLSTILVLDGTPDAGMSRHERIVRGLEVWHSGRRSADNLIVELVDDGTVADRVQTLVITDDRALTERVRRVGGRTARLRWLEGLLYADPRRVRGPDRPTQAGPGSEVGQGRRPPTARPGGGGGRPPASDAGRAGDGDPGSSEGGEDERVPWRPGRGATRKCGNARRAGRRP